MTAAPARWAWRLIAGAALALAALPIASWVHPTDPGPSSWTSLLEVWAYGAAIVAAVSLLVGRGAAAGGSGWKVPPIRIRLTWLFAVLAVALSGLSALVMLRGFAGNPHLVDEVAQLFQARAFAAGRLAAPPPEPAASFVFQLTTVTAGGWVSQFPPGESALLAIGTLLHAPWLVNPLLGGLGVLLIGALAWGLYGPKTAAVTAILYAASAWVLFSSASYMNHVAAITASLAAWSLVWARRARAGHYVMAGVCLAVVAATRPLDAVAAGLPIAGWVVWRHRWQALGWLFIGTLPVLGVWGLMNWKLYGNPLLLGYSALYGPAHGLGFHIDPYGVPYTPLVALSNMAVAVRRLNIYLFEWPLPALAPLVVWGLAARHRHPSDLWLAFGLVAAPVLYFFYWHSGFYLGPRFYYAVMPFLIIGTARAWLWMWHGVRNRSGGRIRWDLTLATAAGLIVVWGCASFTPARYRSYRDSLPTFKLHPERAIQAAQTGNALVLVPESWGSRVIARLWALGVPPGLVEHAYRTADLCDLDLLARAAQRERLHAAEVVTGVDSLLRATGAAVARVPGAPDPSLRLRTDRPLAPECRVELQRDLNGFTVYGNLAWMNDVGLGTGIVFARDLFEDNAALFERYAGWDLWRFAPPNDRPGALPVLTRLGQVGRAQAER